MICVARGRGLLTLKAVILTIILGSFGGWSCIALGQDDLPADGKPAYRLELIPGKVVWQAEVLKSEFGISTVPEAAERILALHTEDGRLIPLVENLRGRAFRKDERLRGEALEILARVYEKQPCIQVVGIYQMLEGARHEVDYWCDVCAIVMYETGPCSCCQDHNRLRRTPVEEHPLGDSSK